MALLFNSIAAKTAVSVPGDNAHVLLTQDVTVNGETVQDVRRIELEDFLGVVLDIATDQEVAAYLGIS